jgi:hypothetical protein
MRLKEQQQRWAEQARFGRTQVLELLLKMDVSGKPVPEYPPVQKLADETFDETQVPALWQQALEQYPGTECVGYYFAFDVEGGSLRRKSPGFFVLTVDGKIAWISTGGMPW